MIDRRKAAVIIGACMIAASSLTGCGNNGKSAVQALEKGNYQEAQEKFKKMTEQEDKKKAAEGYRGLGMTYFAQEDYAKALEMFLSAVESGATETPQLYHLMGSCAMQVEEYENALEYYKTGLALAETAGANGETSDHETEIPDAEMLREMKHNEVICYERLADWEQAKEKINEYLEEYPDDEEMIREATFLETR